MSSGMFIINHKHTFMCAIAGIFDPYLNVSESNQLITKMLESMEHRGPDASGIFNQGPLTIGHNRLSIIDLSSNANQPFEYDDLALIFNGEIYNYIEIKEILKSKGYRFTTASDTEVVAASFKEWGKKCVDQFIGMWALAIWDKKDRKLFCSRDRFGIKPFSYLRNGSRLYFASEIKALKKSPLFFNKLNENQIARSLQLGWIVYKDETFFEAIKNLPAAHNLFFDGQTLSIERYWDVNLLDESNDNAEEKSARFLNLFSDSVRLQMRSDVKIGTCLSGGIDSSAIVSTISHLFQGKSIDAFTIFYDKKISVDERPWANEVITKYPNVNWHTFSPGNDEILDAFEQIHYYADTPLDGSSHISQFFVMRLAAQNKVKVLLDGQGSDEYLGGYMHAFDRLIGHQISNLKLKNALASIYWHKKLHQLKPADLAYVIMKSIVSSFSSEQSFYAYAFKNKETQIFRNPEKTIPFHLNGVDYNNSFSHYLYQQVFTATLPTLLHFEDRNSMTFSIESRVPFLDHRLVDYVFKLPNEDKIKKGETKHILRSALNGILPDPIRKRQDKKGFVTPGENSWLRDPLKNMLNIDQLDLPFIDLKKAKQSVENYKNGSNEGRLVWRLISLNQWLKGV